MKKLIMRSEALALLLIVAAIAVGAWLTPAGVQADDEKAKQSSALGAPLEGTSPAHWRITWTEDPATTATVSWSTAAAAKSSVLLYDTEPRNGELAKYAHKVEAASGKFTDKKIVLHYHHAELSKLKPAQTYWFTLVSDGVASREFHFVTAPDGDADFKLLYGGDSRSSRTGRRTMNSRMRKLLEADAEILALVHGGDYVYDGSEMDEWVEWLTDHELTVTSSGRVLPVIPARGNHEAKGPQYDEIFNTPGGEGRNFYATRIGEQFLLVNLNTEISAGGNQADFLDTVLGDNTQRRWQLANYHRPAYPAVKKPSSALQHWVPLFEKYDLDIALESDGHTLKRTCAIRGGKPDATGIVYIGEGGLGVKQRTPDADRWYFKGGVTDSVLHVQKLTISKDSLLVESITHDGEVRDTFTAKPRKR
jgi:hypothetical protein